MMKSNKQFTAFTLAEVLITLGIIGIVAALTLPSLIINYQKKVYAEKVKKSFSTIEQAIRLSEANNGSWRSWDYGTTINNSTEVKNFAETYLVPYFNVTQNCQNGTGCWPTIKTWPGNALSYNENVAFYKFILADGTAIHVSIPVLGSAAIHFDINGKEGPNIYGKDSFAYLLYPSPSSYKLGTAFYTTMARSTLISAGTGCNKTSVQPDLCLTLLLMDNWQIADDYPW